MARLGYVDANGGSGELSTLAERIKAERGGRVLNLYRMLLNSPPVAEGWLALGTAVRHRARLDGRTRELAICKVGKMLGAEYEYHHHEPIARREGVTAEQLAALDAWRESDAFEARDRAVLAYAEAMTRDVRVDDATFAAVRDHFDDQEMLELTTTIAFYNMVCRILVALQVDVE